MTNQKWPATWRELGFGGILPGTVPRHVGLDDIAHLPNVALAIGGKKNVVHVFVHITLAHRHSEKKTSLSAKKLEKNMVERKILTGSDL